MTGAIVRPGVVHIKKVNEGKGDVGSNQPLA